MIAVFLLFSFLLVSVFVALFAWFYIAWKRWQDEFNKRFPPISDEEFVARCTPGVNPAVALKVRRIVAKNLGVEYARLYPSTRFLEDLGAL